MRATPLPALHALAFEAFQDGNMATHDAIIRESLRRKFAAERQEIAQVERRGPGRAFAQGGR